MAVKRHIITADDLLRQQEEPRKKAKLSSDSDSSDDDNDLRGIELSENFGKSHYPSRCISNNEKGTDETAPRTSHVTFSQIGVSIPLQKALHSMAITTPTEVQKACIPQLLSGRCRGVISNNRIPHSRNRKGLHW
jgi:hypothetical protein